MRQGSDAGKVGRIDGYAQFVGNIDKDKQQLKDGEGSKEEGGGRWKGRERRKTEEKQEMKNGQETTGSNSRGILWHSVIITLFPKSRGREREERRRKKRRNMGKKKGNVGKMRSERQRRKSADGQVMVSLVVVLERVSAPEAPYCVITT